MTTEQILLVVLPIVWLVTIVMAYKFGHTNGESAEFERQTRLRGAEGNEYGVVE